MPEPTFDRDTTYIAAYALNAAYRELSSAADLLRYTGHLEALKAISDAKDDINRAKNEIGA